VLADGHGLGSTVLCLRSFAELELASHAALSSLAESARTRLFQDGDTLLTPDHPAPNVLVLLEGQARASMADAGRATSRVPRRSKPHPVRSARSESPGGVSVLRAPALIGLVQVIAGEASGLHVTASGDATALVIPAAAVRYQIEHDFSLVLSTLRVLSRRLLERSRSLPVVDDAALGLKRESAFRDHELTTAEKLLQLRATAWGATANVDAIAEMARDIREVRFSAGDYLFRHGDLADRWYRIEYGTVRCESPRGEAIDVPAGHVLGMIDAHADPQRRYSARATRPVIALEVGLADLHAVLEAHVPLAAKMTALLARHVL
jgi:CRP-like cAMP-binding protein